MGYLFIVKEDKYLVIGYFGIDIIWKEVLYE